MTGLCWKCFGTGDSVSTGEVLLYVSTNLRIVRSGVRILCFPRHRDRLFDPTSRLYNCYRWGGFLREKAAVAWEAYHSPPSTADFKSDWGCTSCLLVCLLKVQKDNACLRSLLELSLYFGVKGWVPELADSINRSAHCRHALPCLFKFSLFFSHSHLILFCALYFLSFCLSCTFCRLFLSPCPALVCLISTGVPLTVGPACMAKSRKRAGFKRIILYLLPITSLGSRIRLSHRALVAKLCCMEQSGFPANPRKFLTTKFNITEFLFFLNT